jgi:hypothetical protein
MLDCVPYAPNPGLPSLPFLCSLRGPLLLDALSTDIAKLLHTLLSPLVSRPHHWLHPLNLEAVFNMLHAFLFPISLSWLLGFLKVPHPCI